MDDVILSLSDRGQLTVPKNLRDQFSVQRFVCRVEDGKIILEPLQTRDEFLASLEAAEKDWDKNGGLTLAQIKKKYKL